MYDTHAKEYFARENLGNLWYKLTGAQTYQVCDLLPSQSKTVARIIEKGVLSDHPFDRNTSIKVWGCSDSGHFQMADFLSGFPGVELHFGPAEPEKLGAKNIHFRSGIPEGVRGRDLYFSGYNIFHSGFTAQEQVSLLPESFTNGLSDDVRGKIKTVAQLLESCSLGSVKYLKDILLSLEGAQGEASSLSDFDDDQGTSASLSLLLRYAHLSDTQFDDEIVRQLVPLFWRECQYAENPEPLECYLNIVSDTPLSIKLSRSSETIRNEFSEVLSSRQQRSRQDQLATDSYAQNERGSGSELGFRRFAPNWPRPHPDRLKAWFLGEMVTPDGTIIADEAYLILREFFEKREILWELREGAISALELSDRTFMDPFQVRSLCRQLATHRILIEDPPFSTKFRLCTERIPKERYDRIRSQFRTVW